MTPWYNEMNLGQFCFALLLFLFCCRGNYGHDGTTARESYADEGTKGRSDQSARQKPSQGGCTSSRFIDIANGRASHDQEGCSLERCQDPEDKISREIRCQSRANTKGEEEKSTSQKYLARPPQEVISKESQGTFKKQLKEKKNC